jgi:hypothetical protein
MGWTLEEALPLFKAVEEICPLYGYHVALTGGVLYKDGPRKDLDMLFYAIRQDFPKDPDILLAALREFGFTLGTKHGWVTKSLWKGMPVDLFFPEWVGAGTDDEDDY